VVRTREAEERRAKEEAERQAREEKQRRKQEEAERKAREEAELREREAREKERLKEEEEKRRREAEEREKKAKQEEQLAARAERGPGAYIEEAKLRSRRERELAAKPRSAAKDRGARKGWGKPLAITLFVLLVIALAVAHIMPIDTSDYERAASEALGRPVKIGSARLSLVTGLQVKLSEVRLGEGVSIREVRAYPELDALLGPRKAFSRIELDRLKLEQDALGQALFVKVKGDNFSVGRIAARNIEFAGPLALPKGLEFEVLYDAAGMARAATVRGPEGLVAKLTLKGAQAEFDTSAASFTLPFAPEISLSKFSAKGTATPQGLQVAEWDGAVLNGTLSGTANVRWGESWLVDGVVTARNINAAVFAPALLSDGKGEGSGKFSMRGQPGKLAAASRLDGSFTVTRGVLGSIDLSRAIQTGGKQATGRTQFNEMNGQATYDRGAVTLRNVTIGAGQLNAGASADIAQNGALSGRIVAEVRVSQQRLSATLNLGGTLKEPQVKN
jgi:AsmA-like C-terminal region